MVGRGELTDTAWAKIAPLLPSGRRRGKQWADHRRVINGILWKVRTGAPWRDLPERLEVVPELPATSSGKVQKGPLREDIVRRLAAEAEGEPRAD